jgi:glycerophosphoryl diester phosphodiesterase
MTRLDACGGMTVNIEIKNLPGEPGFDPEDRLAKEVADLVVSLARTATVVVSSFWPDTLSAARDACPDLPTGLLLASWSDPAHGVGAAVDRGCTALHPHHDLITADLVEEAHRAGLSVATWTVNAPDRLEEVRAAGVDTVITDDVARAVTTLGTR